MAPQESLLSILVTKSFQTPKNPLKNEADFMLYPNSATICLICAAVCTPATCFTT